MKPNQYIFRVPKVGTIRVKANDLTTALMEMADASGIQLVSVTQHPKRPPLCIINKSSVSKATTKG